MRAEQQESFFRVRAAEAFPVGLQDEGFLSCRRHRFQLRLNLLPEPLCLGGAAAEPVGKGARRRGTVGVQKAACKLGFALCRWNQLVPKPAQRGGEGREMLSRSPKTTSPLKEQGRNRKETAAPPTVCRSARRT